MNEPMTDVYRYVLFIHQIWLDATFRCIKCYFHLALLKKHPTSWRQYILDIDRLQPFRTE